MLEEKTKLSEKIKKVITIRHALIIMGAFLLLGLSTASVLVLNKIQKDELTVQEAMDNSIQDLKDLKIFPGSNKEGEEPLTTYTVGDITITKGESTPWPADIPSFVPKFATAQITSTAFSNGTWSVNYDGITKEAFLLYRENLIEGGWQTDAVSETGGDFSFNALKNGYAVTPILTLEDNSLIICISRG